MTDDDRDRRLRRIVVPRTALADLFREDVSIINGIPSDARVEQFYPNTGRDQLEIVISHPSFDLGEEGDVIPREDIVAEVDEPERTNARVIDPSDTEQFGVEVAADAVNTLPWTTETAIAAHIDAEGIDT